MVIYHLTHRGFQNYGMASYQSTVSKKTIHIKRKLHAAYPFFNFLGLNINERGKSWLKLIPFVNFVCPDTFTHEPNAVSSQVIQLFWVYLDTIRSDLFLIIQQDLFSGFVKSFQIKWKFFFCPFLPPCHW